MFADEESTPPADPVAGGATRRPIVAAARSYASIARDVALVIVIALALTTYVRTSQRYPYYFAWDMDLVTGIDTLLIQSGRLPVQISHPSVGMYLILALSQRIGHAVGWPSVIDLTELDRSLDPLAAMAEHTDFSRAHSPIIALGVVVLLWLALRRIVQPGRWTELGLLALLAAQSGLLYQTAMVRSEIFSVFFWALALFAVVHATSTRLRPGLLVVAGALGGLAYLTKLQSLFFVASLAVIAFLQASRRDTARPEGSRDGAGWAAVASLVLFGALLTGAAMVTIPGGFATFTLAYRPTPITALFTGAHLAVATGVWWTRRRATAPALRVALRCGAWMLLGFDLAFAAPFLVCRQPDRGLAYLLYVAKVILLRPNFIFIGDASSYLDRLWQHARHDPASFLTLAALTAAGIDGKWRGWVRLPGAVWLGLALLAALAVLNVAGAVRFVLRDLVWVQMLVVTANVTIAGCLVRGATRHRRRLAVLAGALFTACLATQLVEGIRMERRLDANYPTYGWDEDRWFTNFYNGDQTRYGDIMARHYPVDAPDVRAVARRHAREHAIDRRTVAFVLGNPAITQQRIGVLNERFPLWVDAPEFRVTDVPDGLREAITVDAMDVWPRGQLYEAWFVQNQSEFLDKLRPRGSADVFGVLPRPDLRVLLFSERLAPEWRPCGARPTDVRLVAASGGERIVLQATEVPKYCEFRGNELGRFVVVVVRR